MRLERIELRLVRMPLVHPFETSFGRETERECIIVAAYDQGLVGWGECAASAGPWYSYETTTTAWHVLRDFLIPSLLGQEIGEATELVERFAPVRGHNMAKAGLEAAVWDLLAKERGVSLAHLLGKALRPAQGKARDRVEVGVSIGIQESLPALLERIAAFWEEGYRRVKIKIKPGWDRAVVAEVRHVFPDIPLMVDANSAYTLADVDLFKALDEYDLMMIEQPLGYDDLFDHAQLQREIETPLCLDESIQGPEHARWALELGSCRVINIKAGRVG
ncbi:MAG TPA: o-succinylbenzoate synthase, partial [Anaerolineae bacterium]|nr:o-succinylbenzoate synthase [Anaerolineae bacterium]